ncbi:hypothetical protein SEA_SATIS_163 [Streptomyces phage Satis]|nr:hypothetical protein SEA_SATIS_163 [Streptomyces phage Satis]
MKKKTAPALVTVTLKCGCKVKVRTKPLIATAKYVCRSNQGHGYSVPWTEYQDGAINIQNQGLPVPRLK